MPNIKSAKKRMRQDVKRRARNRWRKDRIKAVVRKFNEALQEGKTDVAAETLKGVYRLLDRTAVTGALHKNTAARRKASLARRLAAAMKT